MFVTLDKIAQGDSKYTDVLLLENYAAFQNRYYQHQWTFHFGFMTLCFIFCFWYCTPCWLLYSWTGWNIQCVWPGQRCSRSCKILPPSKWSLWTCLYTLYNYNHILCKCSLPLLTPYVLFHHSCTLPTHANGVSGRMLTHFMNFREENKRVKMVWYLKDN